MAAHDQRLHGTWTLGQLAELVGGELRGDARTLVRGVAPLQTAQPGDLTWVTSPRFARNLGKSRATAALTAPQLDTGDLPVIVCQQAEVALARVLEAMAPEVPQPAPGVDPRAVVAEQAELAADVAVGPLAVVQPGARVGARTRIHAGVYIGHDVVIGADCVIWPNVVIRERCTLGDRVTVHPNATIGADGFGYNLVDGRLAPIPQIGSVRIGNDVDIGANTCVDRAKCGETVIGDGCKIDNLGQIGHNCQVGPHTCLAAQVGIAGSTTLGSYVLFGGKVGVRDNVHIGDQVRVAACSCIAKDLENGTVAGGTPAVDKGRYIRQAKETQRLPETGRLVRSLLKRVERLEAADD